MGTLAGLEPPVLSWEEGTGCGRTWFALRPRQLLEMLETLPKEDPLKQQQKKSNQALEGYFKARGKVASWRKEGGSSGKPTIASSFFSH